MNKWRLLHWISKILCRSPAQSISTVSFIKKIVYVIGNASLTSQVQGYFFGLGGFNFPSNPSNPQIERPYDSFFV